MATNSAIRVRPSLAELQDQYIAGNTKPLDDLMRAWKAIKELPAHDPRSFFMLGGFHGEPFRGAGWGSAAYWGGYCNHGNVLFPVWHRVYLLKLEEALQGVPGCEQVMLPFWDETSAASLANGIPWALTQETYVLDGETIANPLRSFVFTRGIKDNISGDDPDYSKPKGYETVRYPLSGLVGTEADRQATAEHNAQFPDYKQNVEYLNQNIVTWLTGTLIIDGKPTSRGHVADKYRACLDAPNYTVFSNTTSAAEWNEENAGGGTPVVVPLESPHNSIHLAVGGFDTPSFDVSPIAGANGDMGENDTAGLDPIFFFHHCFVDRVFWLWQKRQRATDKLEIIAEYPGTNSVDSQGPTPGTVPNSWLTLESPLNPFSKVVRGKARPYTALDCINIEKQLGYTYGPGSLEDVPARTPATAGGRRIVSVSGVNRAPIRGSFLVSVFGTVGDQKVHLGTEAVLSRWNVQYCANCQTHLEVKAFFDLPVTDSPLAAAAVPDVAAYDVEIRTRDGLLATPRPAAPRATGLAAEAGAGKRLYRLEVR